MTKNQQRLINYCYNLLAMRRYSIHEMVQKLEAKNSKLLNLCTDQELEEILASLLKANLINDQDYAFFYIDSKIRHKPIGKIKIRHQLRQKGIADELITQSLNKAQIDELELAGKLLLKRAIVYNLTQLQDRKIKGRLLRYLASNGFNGTTSYQAYRDLVRMQVNQDNS